MHRYNAFGTHHEKMSKIFNLEVDWQNNFAIFDCCMVDSPISNKKFVRFDEIERVFGRWHHSRPFMMVCSTHIENRTVHGTKQRNHCQSILIADQT